MASAVEFHTGVPEPLGYCCRLLRKAYRQGATVLCLAPRATLDALDRLLWTFEERDFVPHVRLPGATAAQRARTPIWLGGPDEGADAAPRSDVREVLVSIAGEARHEIAAFSRVIEVVGAAPEEVQRGRELWRQYRQAGVEIVHLPAGATSAG